MMTRTFECQNIYKTATLVRSVWSTVVKMVPQNVEHLMLYRYINCNWREKKVIKTGFNVHVMIFHLKEISNLSKTNSLEILSPVACTISLALIKDSML